MSTELRQLIWWRIRHYLVRLESSDWLLLLLAATTMALLAVNSLNLANYLLVNHQAPHFLVGLILLGLVTGYLNTRRNSLFPPNFRLVDQNGTSDLLAGNWLICLLLAWPIAFFYGRLASQGITGGTGLGSGLSIAGLMIGSCLLGALLSTLRKYWGIISLLSIVWLIGHFSATVLTIETDLVADGSIAGILLATGVIGAMVTFIELRPVQQIDSPRWRYFSLLSQRASWPSFTGSGALIMSSLLTVIRDRFFWVIVGLAVAWSYLIITATANLTGDWLTAFILILPTTLIASFVINKLNNFGTEIINHHRHWPVSPQLIKLAIFFAGLVLMAVLSLLFYGSFLQVPFLSSLELVIITIGAYSITMIISTSQYFRENSGLYGWVWLIIYRWIFFSLTFKLLLTFEWNNLILSCLAIVVLTLVTLGYHQNAQLDYSSTITT